MKGKKYNVVSLFAGCGGTDLGFTGGFTFLGKRYAGRRFNIIWANDIDQNACLTYEKNFGPHVVCGDIKKILDGESPVPLPNQADIVLGGFPCQDFSLAGKRRGFANTIRGLLYRSMSEVIKRTRPKLFVAENVRGLLSAHGGKAIETIVEEFSAIGYHVVPKLYLAADFGVPQMRERVIIVGTDKNLLPPFVHPEAPLSRDSWIPLSEAIGDLEDKKEGEVPNHFWSRAKRNRGQGNSIVSPDKPGPTMRAEHHGNIEIHWNGRRLSAREAARIQSFPDDFVFYPSTSSAYKQVGNAVAPIMAWHIATAAQKFLDENLV